MSDSGSPAPPIIEPARRLRIGILLDSFVQPQWVARALELAVSDGRASPGLVVLNASPASSATGGGGGRLQAWIRNRRFLLHALYSRFDSRRRSRSDDPFAPTDLTEWLAGVPVLRVTPRQTKFADYLEDVDVERILAHDLDVAVRFGFRILRGRSLAIARHGVWSYHHGDNLTYRGGPPAFWEVMNGEPVTGALLQVLSEDLDAGTTLRRGWTLTDAFSVRRNMERLYRLAAPFLARQLRELAEDGPPAMAAARDESTAPAAYSRRLYVPPGNGEMLRAMARLGSRYLGNHLRAALYTEQWFLAYRRSPRAGTGGQAPDLTPFRFRRLTPPPDRFWADPFPVRHDGRDCILFEEFLHRTGKGHISLLELGDHGPNGDPVRVLERDYHLSYPFAFEYRGEHFLMPEAAARGRVEVWRATRFPFEWTLEHEMLAGLPLRDATIAEIDGRWWLFAAASEPGNDSCDNLFLFSAASPFGPWSAHRRNPVVSDVRRARPAGRLFCRGGRWYRPAQDGSRGYGSGITIQRLDRLDDDRFEETPVTRLDPCWHPDVVGIHTVNAIDGLTVVDARRRLVRWSGR